MVSNGQIDLRQLERIASDRYVSPGCARAWRGFSAAMGGLTVGNAPDSCYRSLAWQNYRWAHQPPRAARPGTSNHGLGQAIDMGNYYRFSHTTLVRVGRQFGFIFDTGSEPWHIKYTGSPNYYPLAAGGSGTLLSIRERLNMDYVWLVNANSKDGKYKVGEFWYQASLNAPFSKIETADYTARYYVLKGFGVPNGTATADLAFRYTIHGDELAKRVLLRGKV
jgi:hypothetical protein